MNKIKCPHGVSPKGNCDMCLKKYREKYIKRYHQSIEYKEYQKEYRQTPKYKEYQKEYRQTPKHKEYIRKYMRQYNSKVFNPAPAKPLHSLSEGETSSDRISDGLKSGISPVSPSKETGGGFTIISMGKIESDEIKKEAKK